MLVARMMTVIVGKVVIVVEIIKSKNRTRFLVNVDPQRIVDFRVFLYLPFFLPGAKLKVRFTIEEIPPRGLRFDRTLSQNVIKFDCMIAQFEPKCH